MSSKPKFQLQAMSDLCEDICVGIASSATHAYAESGIPLLRNQDIKPNRIEVNSPIFVTPEYDRQYKNKRLNVGDILISRTGNPGIAAVVPKKYHQAQCFTALIARPKTGVNSDYLAQYINSTFGQKFFEQNGAGGSQKNVGVGSLVNMEIPVPIENSDQEKIVDMLSTWDRSFALEESLLVQFKNELDGFIESLIGTENMTRLGDACTEIKDGTHASHQDVKGGIPLLSAKDIAHRKIKIPEDARTISAEDFNQIHKKFVLSNGDLLLTIVGTIGRVALVSEYNRNFTFQRSVAYLRFKENFLPEFYTYVFESRYFQNELRRRATQSAQPGVYLGSLAEILIPSPSKSTQEKVTEFLSTLDRSIKLTRQKIRLLKLQKNGLMQELFGNFQ